MSTSLTTRSCVWTCLVFAALLAVCALPLQARKANENRDTLKNPAGTTGANTVKGLKTGSNGVAGGVVTSNSCGLSSLSINAYGKEDPLVTFEKWRRHNAVSLPVTPPIMKAHLEWLKLNYADREAAAKNERRSIKTAPASKRPAAGSLSSAVVPLPTATVGTNVNLAGGVSNYQGEVSIAVNPNNSQQLVAGANTFYADPSAACQASSGTTYGTQALYGSSDGGATWTYNCAPWPPGVTSSGTTLFGSDPSMAWDNAGNAYAVYMLINNSAGAAIVVAKSIDAGASWSNLGIVVDRIDVTTALDDKELMAVDTTVGGTYSYTNRMYVVWDEGNVERVAYSDGGTTWTTVVLDSAGGDIGGDVAIGPDGTVYAVWDRYSQTGGVGTGDVLVFAKSTDGGATYSAPAVVLTHNLASFGTNNTPPAQDQRGVNPMPSIAVDRDTSSAYFGEIYVCYCDFPPTVGTGTDLNTYVIDSTDGGATWSSQLKVNDDTGTATQFFPWLTVDQSSGSVFVSWYDTRNDANNTETQTFLARSTDGGATFLANIQVAQPSAQFANTTVNYSDDNSTDNTNYNANQYGDYAQIAAAGGTAWPIWTDTRQFYPTNSSTDIEDVGTAAITFCTTPGTPTGLTATVPADNEIDLSWTAGTPAGATYNIYRSTGACPGGTFSLIASGVTASTYTDTTVSGGITYSYQVSAVDSTGGCESAQSTCAQATATGTCTLAPTFVGLTSVVNPGDANCTLNLSWSAATANCAGPITYNVYRDTATGFTPGASNLIAGVTVTAYSDTNALANGTPYYYVVRAMDVSNGVEDANTVEVSGTPTGPVIIPINEDFEEAGGEPTSGGTWSHTAAQGTDDWAQSTSGYPNSPTHTFFSSDVGSLKDDYLVTPSFTVSSGSTMTFWHTYNMQSGNDGCVIEISTDGGTTWTDLGPDITAGGYTGTISTSYSSPIAGRSAWTGGTIGTETQVSVDLSSYAGQAAQVRFRLACDTRRPSTTGWYIDDVVVQTQEACATATSVKPVPDGKWIAGTEATATKTVADGSSINLTWDTTTCTDTNYNLYYGNGSGLATYTLSGSNCGLGNTGTATWTAVPAVPTGETFIWWTIVGTDGVQTESSWGKDSAGTERHPAASGQCGFTAKSTATTCP